MITRKEIFTTTDALNNLSGRYTVQDSRYFECLVCMALRIIIHILMKNISLDEDGKDWNR